MTEKETKESLSLQDLIEKSINDKTISFPLSFQFLPVELLSKQFTKLNNNHAYRIHYLGFRPISTSAIHKKYANNLKTQYQYSSEIQQKEKYQRYSIDLRKIVDSLYVQQKLRDNAFYKSNVFYRAFEGMNPTINLENQYIFNSTFEAGNLDCVIKIKQTEFDLFLRVDSNAKSHLQWFYFSIKNGNKQQKIKLNICNLSKSNNLYQHKMRPYIFSHKKFKENGVQWAQNGINLGLQIKQLRYQYLQEKSVNQFYCLQIQYQFQYKNDQVFFAYCVPYTYSKLIYQINQLPDNYTTNYVLGKSLAGVDIPLLYITDRQSKEEKKNILITGRMHPGQSNSSYMLQGFIKFIISNTKQASWMRKRMNFYIIPMVNPDGVILGNSRTSIAGKDLNRQFLQANKDRFPEVFLIRQFASKVHQKDGIFMYLDFHGHSRKKNTFFYGPDYAVNQSNYYKSRIFPKLIQKINPNFRFYSCSFNIDEQKKKTARATMFEHLKIVFTYTIQTSIGFYYDSQNFKTCQFNAEEWRKMGHSIAEGLNSFVVGCQEYQQILKERRLLRHNKRPPTAYVGTANVFQGKTYFEPQIDLLKRTQPLKIVYNDRSLFGSLIDQIRKPRGSNFIKQIDEDIDSDDYDEKEDLQILKMKQFNNLLSQNRKKQTNLKFNKHIEIMQQKALRQKHAIQNKIKQNFEEEELKFFMGEDNIVNRPSTSLNPRRNMQSQSKSQKKIFKSNNGLLKTQVVYKNSVSSQNNGIRSESKKMNRQYAHYYRQKIVSETRLAKKQQNNQTYFGQLQLQVNKVQKKSPQRHSIFLRDKDKSLKLSQQPYKNKIITQFDREKKQKGLEVIKKKSPSKIQNKEYINKGQSQHKSVNYEFKFDHIDSSTISRDRLRQYFRTKANKATRHLSIGPASFYGLRQSINTKLTNKLKYLEFERNDTANNRQNSIKVINF